MIEGVTKSGFAFSIDDDALDDFELLEDLNRLDSGAAQVVPDIVRRLLGAEQLGAMREHLRGENGRVKVTAAAQELADIMAIACEQSRKAKN